MRKLYLDNIKWITVVIVVIFHVIYMFNGVQTAGVIGPFYENQIQDAFQYLVYPWFMALLFAVSGMSSKYYLDNQDVKQFRKDRTRKLLVPSTIGLLVFQWTTGYYNMKIAGAFDTMSAVPKPVLLGIMVLFGTGVLWYIQVLWVLSMVLLLVRKIEKDKLLNIGAKTPVWLIALLAIPAYLMAQILNTPMVTVYRFGIYGFCFFVGYFIFSHEEVIEKLTKYWAIFDIIAAGLGISYTGIYFGENYAVEPVINNVNAMLFCWFAILAAISTMKKFADKENTFSKWMSKKSWGLYVFHYLPLAMAAFYLTKYASNLPASVIYLLVAVSSFTGAFILNEIISRIPFLRWAVLGIKKKMNM